VAERGVAEVVHDRRGLAHVRGRTESVAESTRELRDLERVGEPRAEVVGLSGGDDAGRALQATERPRVDEAVEVALEGVPVVGGVVTVRVAREVMRPVAVLAPRWIRHRVHPVRTLPAASPRGPPDANGAR